MEVTMFSTSLESTLNIAFNQARNKRHEFITVEHLLLSLLDNSEASIVLTSCGANLDRLRAGLGIFIDETTPQIPMHMEREIQPTLSFQRVLQRAIYQVQTTGRPEVTGTNVLTAIFGEQDSQAVYFLNQENVTRIDVVNYLTQGVSRFSQSDLPSPSFDDPSIQESPHFTRESQPGGEENLIETYAVNLNELARSGKLDPVIGRSRELERAVQILCRRVKNNPLFTGEAGVGKTAIAEGLAQMIVNKKVPRNLSFCTVYSLDLGTMLAGTKYRGDFEKRFKSVLKALSKYSGAIIFIDEIHNLVGAGSATGGTMDAANLIKPLLSSGELRCMGATTYDEYRNFIAKDQALLRRFQKVDIEEPNYEHTLKILHGLKQRFESYHQVSYSDAALERTVELTTRYLTDRHLPDKAIDVIDEAGALQQMQSPQKRRRVIRPRDIEQVLSKIARIPIDQLTTSDKQLLKSMPDKLKQEVFGQDVAIEKLADAIKLSRAGLRNVEKPVGSFLMAGPTGVGKTELCKQLAKNLGVELIRFDMSEYMEQHAVSRLIGAPPGYVGFDQGGLLTEAIIKQPHAVLLLDEIEKAHFDMYNILLQVMDYGMLTDNNGRKADFRHVIIIMTTNAGADILEKNSFGFAAQNNSTESLMAVKKRFAPEFRNRLDSILQFNYLDAKVVSKIVDKNLKELSQQLKPHRIRVSLSKSAKQWLIEHGYDRSMGARPMERLFNEQIRKPLSEEILFGSTKSDRVASISVKANCLCIKIKNAQKQKALIEKAE
jgi:ATP-dependent Clp protease ATP-binding subunit ClpA